MKLLSSQHLKEWLPMSGFDLTNNATILLIDDTPDSLVLMSYWIIC